MERRCVSYGPAARPRSALAGRPGASPSSRARAFITASARSSATWPTRGEAWPSPGSAGNQALQQVHELAPLGRIERGEELALRGSQRALGFLQPIATVGSDLQCVGAPV